MSGVNGHNKNGLKSVWKNLKLKEVCLNKEGLRRGPFGSAIKKEFFVPDGYKVYEQANAIYDDAVRGRYFISESKYKELENFEVKEGDFIVSCSGTLGRISQIPKGAKPGVINQALLRIRLKNGIVLNKYFLYYFRSSFFQKKIVEEAQGTAMSNLIGTKDFKEIEIPIPSIEEQKNIILKIEELFSELDKSIEQLKSAQQQLKGYRQSVLKWAFEGKLTNQNLTNGQLPKAWKVVRTGQIIETINNGYTPKKEFLFERSGEVPFIKVYNLNFDGTLNFSKNPTFIPSSIHNKYLKRSICFPGDVLTNIVGPPLGKVSIVSSQFPEWNINQAIVVFRPSKNLLSKYLSYYLQNPETIHWLESTSKATAGQFNIKVSTCREIPIPICSVEEQKQIIHEIECRLSVADKLEGTITNSLQQADALRQSILKKAFDGQLI